MNRELLILSIGMLFSVSCTKEPVVPELDHPQSANIQFSQAEIERLPLLSDNHRRSQEQVIGIVEAYSKAMPEAITKVGKTLAITDSLILADATTKAGGIDAAPIYVVSFGEGAGFALVGGDNRLPYILGYVEQGNYELGKNPGFDILMEEMANGARAMIAYKESLRDSVYDALRVKLGIAGTIATKGIDESLDPNDRPTPPQYDVPEHFDRTETVAENLRYVVDYQYGPLLKTQWWQWAPFNNFRTDGSPTGCVATAIGQIMAYHKYPASISNSLFTSTYLWDQYSTSPYESAWTSEAAASVSQLMCDIGQLVHMTYAPDGSGASCQDYGKQAFNLLGYSCTEHEQTSLTSKIDSEAHAGRPVHICGVNSDGGAHAWVADGSLSVTTVCDIYVRFYLNDQYLGEVLQSKDINQQSQVTIHHNLGWGGSGDGWYDLLFPDIAGYKHGLRIAYDIKPL